MIIRIWTGIFVLIYSSFSVSAEVLDEEEERNLLARKPNIIGSSATNRNLQFWVFSSTGRGIIWCETFVNEDKVRTETICFDDVDPDD